MASHTPPLFLFGLLLFGVTVRSLAADVASLPSMPSMAAGDDATAGGVAAPRSAEREAGGTSQAVGYKGIAEAARSAGGVKTNKNKIAYNRIGTRIDAKIENSRPVYRPIQRLGEGRPKTKPPSAAPVPPPPDQTTKWHNGNGILRNQ